MGLFHYKNPIMDTQKLMAALKNQGYPQAEVVRLVAEVQKTEDRQRANTHARNWTYVLTPLRQAIKSMQTGRVRWQHDAVRAPLYDKYLRLLMRTRAILEEAKWTNFEQKTIPQIAAERGIPESGLTWTAWVSPKAKEACLLAFEHLYRVEIPNAKGSDRARGKRMIPFQNRHVMSASDKRWLILHTNALLERRKLMQEGAPEDVLALVEFALEGILQRGLNDAAPVAWDKLLPKNSRQRYAEWLQTAGRDAPAYKRGRPLE